MATRSQIKFWIDAGHAFFLWLDPPDTLSLYPKTIVITANHVPRAFQLMPMNLYPSTRAPIYTEDEINTNTRDWLNYRPEWIHVEQNSGKYGTD